MKETIKIQKRAEQFNIRKRYKKGDVVVIKGDRPMIATVIKMVANGVVETTSHAKIAAQALRPATSIEMRYVKDKRWAEVEFLEDKPKEVKPKIQEMPEKAETNQTEVETLKAEIERLKEKNKELDFQKSRLIIELDELSSDYLGKMELIQSLESENEKQFSRVAKVEKLVDNLSDENYVQERKIDSLHKEIETITKYNLEQLKLILKND